MRRDPCFAVQVVAGTFEDLAEKEGGAEASERADVVGGNAHTVQTYESQVVEYSARCQLYADRPAYRYRYGPGKPPTQPRLLKVPPDSCVTLRLEVLPALGVPLTSADGAAAAADSAAGASRPQCPPQHPAAVLEALHPGGGDAVESQWRFERAWGAAVDLVGELINAGALAAPDAVNRGVASPARACPWYSCCSVPVWVCV